MDKTEEEMLDERIGRLDYAITTVGRIVERELKKVSEKKPDNTLFNIVVATIPTSVALALIFKFVFGFDNPYASNAAAAIAMIPPLTWLLARFIEAILKNSDTNRAD